MQDAERLWHTEHTSDTPTTLAALCCLSMAGIMHGNESLRGPPMAEARRMAERMKLFGSLPTEEDLVAFQQLSPEKMRGMASASWGVYGWLT